MLVGLVGIALIISLSLVPHSIGSLPARLMPNVADSCETMSFRIRTFGGFVLERPSATHDVSKGVIPFMTGVLEQGFIGLYPGSPSSPGPRPRVRILDGEPVHERVGADTPQPFGDTQGLGRAS